MSMLKQAQLVGTRVVSQDGYVLGDVADVVIDTDSWKVTEICVRVRRQSHDALRLHKPMFGSQTVSLPAEEISGVGEAIVLRHTRDQLAFVTGGEPPPTEQELLVDDDQTEEGVVRAEPRGARRMPPTGTRPGGASPSSPR